MPQRHKVRNHFMNRILVNVVWFSSSRVSIVRNHDFFMRKNNREYQSQNPIAYCTEGFKCSWKRWCPLFSNSDLSGRGQGRGKMQMIFMKCKCFSSLCSIRHKNGQYVHGAYFKYTVRLEIKNRPLTSMWCFWGNWRGQYWSVSLQRCLRIRTLKRGFSSSRKNFQSSN